MLLNRAKLQSGPTTALQRNGGVAAARALWYYHASKGMATGTSPDQALGTVCLEILRKSAYGSRSDGACRCLMSRLLSLMEAFNRPIRAFSVAKVWRSRPVLAAGWIFANQDRSWSGRRRLSLGHFFSPHTRAAQRSQELKACSIVKINEAPNRRNTARADSLSGQAASG